MVSDEVSEDLSCLDPENVSSAPRMDQTCSEQDLCVLGREVTLPASSARCPGAHHEINTAEQHADDTSPSAPQHHIMPQGIAVAPCYHLQVIPKLVQGMISCSQEAEQ